MSLRNTLVENNFNANLDAKTLNVDQIHNGSDELKLAKPVADVLADEYCQFNGSVAGVANVQKELDTVTIVNNGDGTYLPLIDASAKTVRFNEAGLYEISFHVMPTTAFLSSDVVHLLFWDLGDSTTRVESLNLGSGLPANTTGYSFSALYHHVGPFRTFKLYAVRPTGTSSIGLDIRCLITRLK